MATSTLRSDSAIEAPRPYRRVLAACLLDESGVRVVLRAALLPLATGAHLVALHVVRPWPGRSGESVESAGRALERLVVAARQATAAAGNDEAQVAPRVLEGWPALEIVRAAWQERAELVVVGPPGAHVDRTARATIFRVMRRADLPLLVARTDPLRPYRRVLCAVDRSVTAVDTIALAGRLGGATARALTLFHAYQAPFERWVGSDEAELRAEALAHVRALARAFADEVPVRRVLVRRGNRFIEILRAAVEERADLVVLGTHGRPGVLRALFGSAAEWVVANAPFDVAVAAAHRGTLERR